MVPQIFGDDSYLEAAKLAAKVVWKIGILSKGPGLCHGASGNGYTFLAIYRITKDRKYLFRALKFAEAFLALQQKMETPDEYVLASAPS
jgi:lantibiotic modifying enzyme